MYVLTVWSSAILCIRSVRIKTETNMAQLLGSAQHKWTALESETRTLAVRLLGSGGWGVGGYDDVVVLERSRITQQHRTPARRMSISAAHRVIILLRRFLFAIIFTGHDGGEWMLPNRARPSPKTTAATATDVVFASDRWLRGESEGQRTNIIVLRHDIHKGNITNYRIDYVNQCFFFFMSVSK